MNSPEKSFFDKELAKKFDHNWEKVKPITHALHLLIEINLQTLPLDSHILCVGTGTGAEVLALAKAFPDWRFTALDSSSPMLEVCQRKVEEAGFSNRCNYHFGYIDSLPDLKIFDAATSILVSQFITDFEQRIEFYEQIKKRLKSGSYFFNADLAIPERDSYFDVLMESWLKLQTYTGLPEEKARKSISSWNKTLSVPSPQKIEDMIQSVGFANVTPFYQALFIHTWYAKVR